MIKTLSETVIWMAKERLKALPFKDINSAIVSITTELDIELSKFMVNNRSRKNGKKIS